MHADLVGTPSQRSAYQICTYIYIHIHIHRYACTRTHTHIHTRTHAHTHMHTHVHTVHRRQVARPFFPHAPACMCAYVCVCARACVCACACACVCACGHVYVYVYVHVSMCMCMCMCMCTCVCVCARGDVYMHVGMCMCMCMCMCTWVCVPGPWVAGAGVQWTTLEKRVWDSRRKMVTHGLPSARTILMPSLCHPTMIGCSTRTSSLPNIHKDGDRERERTTTTCGQPVFSYRHTQGESV
jgi:hypothetical protein